MEYTHLGRTGLLVSRICLGTMNFGPVTNQADSHEIMDRAHEQGINFFDTANVYGWEDKGLTERIIGDWFALAWLLHQPAVTAPIVGPRTLDHLDGALRALDITLDAAALARIDEIFPGPGGTAPEAYAW